VQKLTCFTTFLREVVVVIWYVIGYIFVNCNWVAARYQ